VCYGNAATLAKGDKRVNICVFCGSSPGKDPVYGDRAAAFGRLLAARDIGLVYGGAQLGLMGVIPQGMVDREIAHAGLTELRVVSSMHERKAQMAALSDAFVALPGGIGTFEELFEVWTWSQLGLHAKPCGILNVHGFYDRLHGFLDHVVSEGFLRPVHREALLIEDDAEALLAAIARFQAPAVAKWLGRDET
jgi:uncharacterized protein (TIGR00730 family)